MVNLKKAALLTLAAYFGLSALSITAMVLLARAFLNKKHDLGELQKLGTALQTFPSVKIHRLDMKGLQLRVDVLLKNPTGNGFKMHPPFVSIEHKGQPVGSSQVQAGQLSIAPFSELRLEPIYLTFPLLQLFSVAGDLYKALNNGQAVNLLVITRSQVDPMWRVDGNGNWLPQNDFGLKQLRAIIYEDKKEVTLRKQQTLT